MTLENTSCVITVNGKVSDDFTVKRGLRQRNPLSTVLNYVVMNKVIREGGINRRESIIRNLFLAYADDVLLITRNRKELERITLNLLRVARCMGLPINKEKRKFMKIRNNR